MLCEVVEQFGVWGFDGGAVVGPAQGISPLEGALMLRLQETAPCCGRSGAAAGTGADCAQVVSLAQSQASIQAGHARADFSAAFNRVAGNAQTDTQFSVIIRAFDRPNLAGFRTGCNSAAAPIASASASLITDADPATWERAQVSLELPATTTFVLVYVSAVENVTNGVVYGSEFDGHFADDARLVIGVVCDSIDFNGDGLFPDTADIDDFLSVFSGGPCSTGNCGDIDFNNDGLFPDTGDIDSLLSVFSGGGCA